ncbi:MAG: TfuA-related McrA-glycine thioamidation protein [Methanosarcinaceae archaeon]|nr:TfuA-related McrA-glycine thioamidation protein [Methanosarcinaceae archaeon]NKQ39231.1 TfuA-related McrA-glycine thioamidation protein [Methanosarcinales archaeon]
MACNVNKKDIKALVFLGTSISIEEAKKILDIDYLPPIVRCDVKKAFENGYTIIGIVDGMFFNKTTVSHREILTGIKNGVTIIGGGSMGALRASELAVHGMEGVGKIYHWYADGTIEDDDEVAVSVNPETFESMSNPMVNIRESLNKALRNSVIDEIVCEAVCRIAKETHYSERTYHWIIKQSVQKEVLSFERGEILYKYCIEQGVDVKKEDAILVLNRVKEMLLD